MSFERFNLGDPYSGKWVFEEFFGAHPVFDHGTQREGFIESLPSKLKEVYKRYLEVLEENERDIIDCGWDNYRISEKKLIETMEERLSKINYCRQP